jgi:hypothetical protein|tara:strand:+ start:240 stop:524 length:285 start_codon:yes stop_codon:yes gene_type:complete
MKVNIWVHKRDVINNKITNYHTHGLPQSSNWTDYVQIQITQDEFARLEDKDTDTTYPEFVKKHYEDSVFNDNDKGDEDNDEGLEHDQNEQPFAD